MNAFIAIAVFCLLVAIVSGLIANFLKILILGKFHMNEEWFEFKLSYQDLKSEWSMQKRETTKTLIKTLFFLLSNIALLAFYIGMIFLAINFI